MRVPWGEKALKGGHLSGLGAFAKRSRWRVFWRDLSATFRRWSAMEERRFILWAPCLMAAGIVLWFSLNEPPGAGVAVFAAASACLLWTAASSRRVEGARLAARAMTCFLGGMALIALRTEMVEAPLIPTDMSAEVRGTLVDVEMRERDRRYNIRVESISYLDDPPRKVRVIWRGEPNGAKPGDRVSLRAQLTPPPGPAMPGGYDFARAMRYEGIGGVGFSYEPPRVIEGVGASLRMRIEALREAVADRVERKIGGPEGAVAAALMTGKRERIGEENVNDLRDAGLAHLLAISGLHMGLVCGFLFWTLRALLVRSEWLALHAPIKKWAAAGALLGGLFYLALSGGAWSAQRAFIMAAIVFGAILFDRRGISLRNAALAALVIMTLRPEAVVAPGFQMSFAAVVTLISAFGFIDERWPREGERSTLTKVGGFLGGLTLTSFLAGLATGPFAAYHFGRIASFGLLGNMLAMPIITLAVMPAMVLAMFLMPFGLDGPVLFLVGQGIGIVLAIADWTAGLPGAVKLVPQLAPAGIVLASAGLLTLALARAPWRLAGAALVLLALPAGLTVQQPDIFLSRDLRNVGVVQESGEAQLAILSKRRDRFTVEAWLQSLGTAPEIKMQETMRGCTKGPCGTALPRGGRLTVITDRADLMDACAGSEIVVLRARSAEGDARDCSALLVSLRADGTHPAASLRREATGWVLDLAR
ncbi:ComEC/Rec2 family competence protein [Parvularcula lutaonensis]|uniref:ComEC/Rec2 family competence protein n=1 Tax=Parvularcula lutaonensis TaxID=491923 RepID=A0ABV7MDE3_9PROT|nr:ComEC/Rec2 family competence protein [Parvularcula lutaonensis]GGY52379.1 competence protein ComEC [Parvularcula lutaonensis]